VVTAAMGSITQLAVPHDWAFVLGPSHLNMLDHAALIATAVTVFAVVLVIAGIAACASGLLWTSQRYSPLEGGSQYGLGSRRPPVVPSAPTAHLAGRSHVRYPPGAMQ
jgi:hypothetical protein